MFLAKVSGFDFVIDLGVIDSLILFRISVMMYLPVTLSMSNYENLVDRSCRPTQVKAQLYRVT